MPFKVAHRCVCVCDAYTAFFLSYFFPYVSSLPLFLRVLTVKRFHERESATVEKCGIRSEPICCVDRVRPSVFLAVVKGNVDENSKGKKRREKGGD